ncbi:MAG: hypothetical protein WDN26_10155 [Chitinophagaceae bacterium]
MKNEFTRLTIADSFLITGAKKKFLKMGYSCSCFDSTPEKIFL